MTIIILYFTCMPGPNIAFGKSASQGPGTFMNMTADNAVNNETNDNGDPRICSHTTWGSTTSPAWWQVDFDDTYRLTGIRIYNRHMHGMYFYCMHHYVIFAVFLYHVSEN